MKQDQVAHRVLLDREILIVACLIEAPIHFVE
jgi:kynurenine formamidase